MAGKTKTREASELIAGGITMTVALILIIVTVVCMRTCTVEPPSETTAPGQASIQTIAPAPTQLPLIPNPYDAGDFAYDRGYLTCLSGVSLLGVDVSEYQGKINWEKVAGAGVEFAMVRLGFRGWGSQGEVKADARGMENLQGAADAGLKVGVYFFSQAITPEEAREEARFVLAALDGRKLDMPVVFDWEFAPADDARTADVTAEKLNACAMAFCQEIESAGYAPMVYFNLDLAKRMYDLELFQRQGYDFWLAMYSGSMTYPYRINMWQYSDGGSVPGIDAFVDLDLYFVYE